MPRLGIKLVRCLAMVGLVVAAASIVPIAKAAPVPEAVGLDLSGFFATGDVFSDAESTFYSLGAYPGGKQIYLGTQPISDQSMRALTAVSLSSTGAILGVPLALPIDTFPLTPIGNPGSGTDVCVRAIGVNGTNNRLYIGPEWSGNFHANTLGVYTLNSTGAPTGTIRMYPSGNTEGEIDGIAVHPTHPMIYLASEYVGGITTYALDSNGEPTGTLSQYTTNMDGALCVGVSGNGQHLYVGAANDSLVVYDLDSTGAPNNNTSRLFVMSSPQLGSYCTFQMGTNALYMVRANPVGGQPPVLGILPLSSTNGNPTGTQIPLLRTDINPLDVFVMSPFTFGVDSSNSRLWVSKPATFTDAITGLTDTDSVMTPVSYTIKADGTLTTTNTVSTALPGLAYAAVTVPPSNGGIPIYLTYPVVNEGNRTSGWKVRINLTEAQNPDGSNPLPMSVTLICLDNPSFSSGVFNITATNTPTAYTNVDSVLENINGEVGFQLNPMTANGGGQPGAVSVKIDLANSAGTILKSMTENVIGGAMGFVLPGYASTSANLGLPSGAPPGAKPFTGRALDYLAIAQADTVAAADRPVKILTNCFSFTAGEGNAAELATLAQTMQAIGINTVGGQGFWGLSTNTINNTLNANGEPYRGVASYGPGDGGGFIGGDLDYYTGVDTTSNLNGWADYWINVGYTHTGGTTTNIADFYMADEPGWAFPGEINTVLNTPAYLTIFQNYLQTFSGLTPSAFGQTSWANVKPITQSVAQSSSASLATRTTFYWQNRFFPYEEALLMEHGRQFITSNLGYQAMTPVDNLTGGNWFYQNENGSGADNATGLADWMESGRLNGGTPFCEDWISDTQSNLTSAVAAMLRCQSFEGTNNPMGAHVVGLTSGYHPSGGKYKILQKIGNGAKEITNYTWGPNCMEGFVDDWSENTTNYRLIADAYRLVGRADSILGPGSPQHGKIAIMMPAYSAIWDTNSGESYYHLEQWGLFYALSHAYGGPIDFVDDIDVANGILTTNDYWALYVTGPNVAATAQTKINTWITGFGTHNRTVCVTPGAGTANEYNTATTTFDTMLGLTTGKRATLAGGASTHFLAPYADQPSSSIDAYSASVISTNASFFYANTTMNIRGPYQVLSKSATTTSNDMVFNNAATGAAMTTKTYTSGSITNRATAFGFYPGYQYFSSPDSVLIHNMPQGYNVQMREAAVIPVQRSLPPETVTLSGAIGVGGLTLTTTNSYRNAVEVETLPITSTSPSGAAVVLLNWSDQPISSVTVTMAITGTFTHAKLASTNAAVTLSGSSGNYSVTIPLTDADIVVLTP